MGGVSTGNQSNWWTSFEFSFEHSASKMVDALSSPLSRNKLSTLKKERGRVAFPALLRFSTQRSCNKSEAFGRCVVSFEKVPIIPTPALKGIPKWRTFIQGSSCYAESAPQTVPENPPPRIQVQSTQLSSLLGGLEPGLEVFRGGVPCFRKNQASNPNANRQSKPPTRVT